MRRPEAIRWLLGIGAAVAGTALLYGLLTGGGDENGRSADADPAARPSPQVAQIVERLPLGRKALGVMGVGISGTDATAPIFSRLAREQPGALFVAERNWSDPFQGTAFVRELRVTAGRSRIPPLIVTSQEGGPYRRLAGIGPARTQAVAGVSGSARGARRWAFRASKQLRGIGFDLNLGLVADVAPLDSAISDRSFGDDPETTARLVGAAVRGCRAAGLVCALRHFPGQAGASADTDAEPATVSLTAAELEGRDLQAFRAGISAGARAVVLSHAMFTAFDPVTPASLTREIVSELLRDELGFGGIAVTDDLSAGAIRSGRTAPAAAVGALAAGADLVLVEAVGPVQERVRRAIVSAVRRGALSEDRLDQALTRVLELKRRRGLLRR